MNTVGSLPLAKRRNPLHRCPNLLVITCHPRQGSSACGNLRWQSVCRLLPVVSQQTQNICITFIQCWTNVDNVGLTLYKCYTNVLCLLGNWTAIWAGYLVWGPRSDPDWTTDPAEYPLSKLPNTKHPYYLYPSASFPDGTNWARPLQCGEGEN